MSKLSESKSKQFNSKNSSNSKKTKEKTKTLQKQHEEALNQAQREIEQMESDALAKMFDGNKK